MGLLELEMSLVTAAEAAADPVGKKRKEPNHVSGFFRLQEDFQV